MLPAIDVSARVTGLPIRPPKRIPRHRRHRRTIVSGTIPVLLQPPPHHIHALHPLPRSETTACPRPRSHSAAYPSYPACACPCRDHVQARASADRSSIAQRKRLRHALIRIRPADNIDRMHHRPVHRLLVGRRRLSVNTLSFVCDHPSPSTRPNARINWYCICSCCSGAAPRASPIQHQHRMLNISARC